MCNHIIKDWYQITAVAELVAGKCIHDCATRRRGLHEKDKIPVCILFDRGTGDCYVLPRKAAAESMSRLLVADRKQKQVTAYTVGVQAYKPLNGDTNSTVSTSSKARENTLMETYR